MKLKMIALAVGVALGFVAAVSGTASATTKPYHAGWYKSIDDLTYEIKLAGWAPSSEVTLFKAVGGSSEYNQCPGIRKFNGSTDFRVGIRPDTTLEIDIWNGQKRTYSFFLTAPFMTDGFVGPADIR